MQLREGFIAPSGGGPQVGRVFVGIDPLAMWRATLHAASLPRRFARLQADSSRRRLPSP
jgi:hypothetical protein